jgi:predicted enzyme related to lactoylglutathione lyase
MTDFNSQRNRVVWFDIPVQNLDRACAFYRGVLAVEVEIVSFEETSFAVIAHDEGNGGCLIPDAGAIANAGVLVYLNADGRIRDALQRVEQLGGRIVEPLHAIGQHGFRAVILDSEGNRVALHSSVDA